MAAAGRKKELGRLIRPWTDSPRMWPAFEAAFRGVGWVDHCKKVVKQARREEEARIAHDAKGGVVSAAELSRMWNKNALLLSNFGNRGSKQLTVTPTQSKARFFLSFEDIRTMREMTRSCSTFSDDMDMRRILYCILKLLKSKQTKLVEAIVVFLRESTAIRIGAAVDSPRWLRRIPIWWKYLRFLSESKTTHFSRNIAPRRPYTLSDLRF